MAPTLSRLRPATELEIVDRLATDRRICAPDMSGLQRLAFAVLAAILPVLASAQSAEPYPSRPVKLLVPYAPGGATDIIARQLAAKLGQALGQPFVVDNRAGASGNIALEAEAKAAPDG